MLEIPTKYIVSFAEFIVSFTEFIVSFTETTICLYDLQHDCITNLLI